jgi:hypothetical protein
MTHDSPRVWRVSPYPLGATRDGMGVNFALISERATGVAVVDMPALPVLPYSLVLLRQGRERRVGGCASILRKRLHDKRRAPPKPRTSPNARRSSPAGRAHS